MSRSLTLPFLRSLRRPDPGQLGDVPETARPSGSLIWVQLPRWSEINAVDAIAERLEAEGLEPTFVLTAPGPPPNFGGFRNFFILRTEPADTDATAIEFLAHWRPDMILWVAGRLFSRILAATDRLGVPRYLLDAAGAGVAEGTAGPWLSTRRRDLFNKFDSILCTTDDARAQLLKLKIDPDVLEVTGALSRDSGALPCTEVERTEIASQITNRPVWLVANCPLSELRMLTTAYRQACRRSHRLLMVLIPSEVEEAQEILRVLHKDKFATALRSDDETISEDVQIYVADQDGELGLWYRVAPVSYLGGTISGSGGPDPFGAAALGSAIMHGPIKQPYQESYKSLRRANAAREVRNGTELGAELQVLLSPDKAARMAHAGWEVISSGAAATERTVSLIRAHLLRLGS